MGNVFFSYDQESAEKAGGGNYINEGGAYIGVITEAKIIKASTGSEGLEFSFESNEGAKANYINVYYRKANGEQIKGGYAVVNALMAVMDLKQLTYAQGKDSSGSDAYFCRDLEGKPVGLFLQKTLTSKQDGSDSYKLDIRVPFFTDTQQTVKEKLSDSPAKSISYLESSYKDKDDRKTASGISHQDGSFNGYQDNQSNDIPWS